MATIKPGDGDPRHGTVNGYGNIKCRCQDCRDAWADYIWDVRQRRLARPIPEGIHGKASTYGNYGCRCTPCTKAHSKDVYDRKKRKAALV